MGKKYIVELGRCERLYKASTNCNGMPNLTWLSPEVDLTSYTEPDLEQVRKEAYEKGYDDAKSGYDNGFENGMIVAWEAARKIADMPYGEEERVFGSGGWAFITKHTASEAIEKIRQYEQEQKQEESSIKYDQIRQGLLDVAKACNAKAAELSEVLAKIKEAK